MRTLIVLSIVLSSLGGCVSQPSVEVFVTDLKPLPSTLFEQRVQLELRIQNLSEKPIAASGIDVRLDLNDRQWARGVSAEPIDIPGLSEGRARVNVSSGVLDSVRQLLGVPNRVSFNYAIRGRLITPGVDKRFRRGGAFSRAELEALGRPPSP